MLKRFLSDQAGAALDRAAQYAIIGRSYGARARSRSESLGPDDRVRALTTIAATWDPAKLTDDVLFPSPAAAAPSLRKLRALAGGAAFDATWASSYTAFDAAIAERYASRAENATAAARLFLHDAARPAAVLIHGYRAGQFAFEEVAWPVSWLYERGLDVAIVALPFHGTRAAPRRPPFFPSSDPRITNDGFRQAIGDLRALVGFLRGRGAASVGVTGMSLGGYTATLLATVEPDLAFVIPIIPLASLADAARDGGRYVGTADEQAAQHDALDRAHLAVSPLARPYLGPPGRALVLAASGDRITPISHARRIATHLGAPLEEFGGGHLLQLWRGEAFRSVGRLLSRLGLFS